MTNFTVRVLNFATLNYVNFYANVNLITFLMDNNDLQNS